MAASIKHGKPNACNLCHLDQTLDWAQRHLHEWYDAPITKTEPDHREVAAGVLWMLKGDAAQRAIAVWAAGWDEAQQAAGAEWVGLYAGRLLSDPYAVVRRMAHRTLETLPNDKTDGFNFIAPRTELVAQSQKAMTAWLRRRARVPEAEASERLLYRPDGRFDAKRFDRLYSERDNRPVTIKE